MQKDYCTEHFDMTGWFLVISLAKNIRKHFASFNRNMTNTFLCSPGPCCWRRAQSRAERETGCSDLFVDTIKLLRPLKTTEQPTTGLLHRSAKSGAGCSWFQCFGRTIGCRNVRWNTFSFRSTLLDLYKHWTVLNSGHLMLTLTLL